MLQQTVFHEFLAATRYVLAQEPDVTIIGYLFWDTGPIVPDAEHLYRDDLLEYWEYREAKLFITEQVGIFSIEIESLPTDTLPIDEFEGREAMFKLYREFSTLLPADVAPELLEYVMVPPAFIEKA